MEFTQKSLSKLASTGKTRTYSDPSTPGLVLRVTAGGAKTYFLTYRMGGRGTPVKWLKIGSFETIPLVRARERARIYRGQREEGIDPVKALEEAASEGTSIQKLWERYKASDYFLKRAARTQDEYRVSYKAHILPKLGNASVKTLTREQVGKWHADIKSPTAANRALAVLSRMMTLAIEVWEIRESAHPCRHVERNPEAPRLRDITVQELAALGRALRALEGQHSLFALSAIKVTLLCWGRVSEVLALRRDRDVFLVDGYALVHEHKGKRKMGTKRLELPPQVVRILKALPQEHGNPYFFPGRKPGEHLTRMGIYHTWLAVCREAKVENLHLHDSRSLAASEAEAQGHNPKTAAAVLGHMDVRTTEKHYARVRKAREVAAQIAAPIAAALEGERTPRLGTQKARSKQP